MKYFYLTVLFLTMSANSVVAKSPALAAKSMSSLSTARDDGAAYGNIVGTNAHNFYSDMEMKKESSEVKIEILAAKAAFEDMDDVIANIERDKLPAPKMKKIRSSKKANSSKDKNTLSFLDKKEVDTVILETADNEAFPKPALNPKRADSLVSYTKGDNILSFLDNKTDTVILEAADNDAFPKPALNPKRAVKIVAVIKEEKVEEVVEKVAKVKFKKPEVKLSEKEPAQLTTYIAATVSDAEKKEIAEIIAEDVAWEADWKKISTFNAKRDDKAFDKLLDDSFSFLPGQVPPTITEGGSKAAKMISAADIEKLFGLEDKDKSKLPDFKITDYADDGRWLWPVDQSAYQRISSKFGYRVHPVTKRKSFHKGVDIAAARGTKVMASRSGKVELVTRHRNLGKYVKIRHKDGSYALYGHLSKRIAKQGRYVKAGDVIGKVGSTGRSTGPHLDFSIRIKEKAVDPLKRLSVPRKLARR